MLIRKDLSYDNILLIFIIYILDIRMKLVIIWENKAQCTLCGDIIESKYRHDWVTCKCGKLSIDGGYDYVKVSSLDYSLSNYKSLVLEGIIEEGTLLRTKDGRKIGNGIVISFENELCKIMTDFGNIKQIENTSLPIYFHLPNNKVLLSEWIEDRIKLLQNPNADK